MTHLNDLVFLLDVDNTLLDNDTVARDLRQHLEEAFGRARQERYWEIFERLRAELGYADYLGALQRYRIEHPRDPHLLQVSTFLIDYPFADRLYPAALGVIRHLAQQGLPVILSDGDVVFQPHKVTRSGLAEAVANRVLIYIHKEQMLEDVEQRYPARRYVVVDDKLRILAAIKSVWGERVMTVFVRQGRYAHDPLMVASYPAADMSVDHIGQIAEYDFRDAAVSEQGRRR